MASPTRKTLVFSCVLLVGLLGCQPRSSGGGRAGPRNAPTADPSPAPSSAPIDTDAARRGVRADALRAEPVVRVRVLHGATRVRAASTGRLTLAPGGRAPADARPRPFEGPLVITHNRDGFVITDGRGRAVQWALPALRVASSSGTVSVDGTRYPGFVELVATTGPAGQATGQIDAVNHVGMERYLPGVLSKELYPGWDPKAYRAQAIAARSYAVWEMNLPRRRSSHFDLEAGQASQAYLGLDASEKAVAAVAATRGQVLVFEGRVLPAFYSSCSGGTGQDAGAVFGEKVDNLAPLRGREHGAWGQGSSKFRWGPVTQTNARLTAAMQRWGRANEHPIGGLTGIRAIRPVAHNQIGRITRFAVTDTNGRYHELHAEELRRAANTPVPGDPPDKPHTLFSSHVEVAVSGPTITFTGRGYGHGVGLCQWGAQGMAQRGYDHPAILGFYYPGAAVSRAY